MRVFCNECGKKFDLTVEQYTGFEQCDGCGQPRNIRHESAAEFADSQKEEDAPGDVSEGGEA